MDRPRLLVGVAETSKLASEALVRALDAETDLDATAWQSGGHRRPSAILDAVVLDAEASGPRLAEAIEEAKRGSAGVLILAEDPDPETIELLLSLGAEGVVSKGLKLDAFVDAVRQVARGRYAFDDDTVGMLVESLLSYRSGERHTAGELSPRQRQVLSGLVRGLANKQIARELGIGVETVKTHVSAILERLEASTRTEAASVAIRRGLVSAPA